ncbi:MAG TPA: cupin domain-containing protein [Anaerolineae bacterium]
MPQVYSYIASLADRLPDIPPDSILSRSLYVGDDVKVTLFGFAPGQELSEHTASQPAILHFLQGDADLMLGNDRMEAHAGTWAHMPPHLPHSIKALTPVTMLLYLLHSKEP